MEKISTYYNSLNEMKCQGFGYMLALFIIQTYSEDIPCEERYNRGMTQGEALDILKTGANVFLTGEPGSGKTHTLNAYIAWLKEHGIEPAITASTGIAATHIGGMTIHAWSGIGVLDHLSPYDLDRIASKEQVVRRIQKTQVLIIDEISMLSADTLSMVDRVMSTIRRDANAFGGVQVVFCGDFFQLPPITRGGRTTAFAYTAEEWKRATTLTCYLTEQHRQEDEEYLSLLKRIRAGAFTDEDIQALSARAVSVAQVSDVPLLFTHNTDVDALNQERLDALPGAGHSYAMEEEGSPALLDGLKRGCLSPQTLVLKKGAVVMCTRNNPVQGYANGTVGSVTGFARGSRDPVIMTIDGRELTVSKAQWVIENEGKVRARIEQIPLRLAWAITVHKSQGMSLDSAAIDLSKSFEYGQGYVALSRVRTLEGLHVLGWNDRARLIHPEVMHVDARLYEESLAAEAAFETLRAEGDLPVMHNNFILACGGTLNAVTGTRAKKKTTHEETLALLASGMPLSEVAKTRKLTVSTVADHAQKLIESRRIDAALLLSAIPAKLVASLPDIHTAFEKHGSEKLAPAYHELFGKYSYDDLKIARVLFEVPSETEVR